MSKTPILFLSDSPDLPSGLARITRSLALRLAAHPAFEVGYLGLGGTGSRSFPFKTYSIPTLTSRASWWGADCLAAVWGDFAGDRSGILMPVWDLSRLEYLLDGRHPFRALMSAGRARLWGYFPLDAEAPDGALGVQQARILALYSRIAAYTDFAAHLIVQSLRGPAANGRRPPAVLPHGVEAGVFRPCGPSRLLAAVPLNTVRLGAVMTNQARKDWGLLMETLALLKARSACKWQLWAHVDRLVHLWDLNRLVEDFGLRNEVLWTTSALDEELAELYTSCTLIVNPAAEGWGYAQAEACLCGVPSLGVDYAAGPEVASHTITPEAWRWEITGMKRPVVGAEALATRIVEVCEEAHDAARLRLDALERFSWERIWPRWLRWFEEGLQ